VIYSLAILQIPRALNIVFSGNLRGGADLAWLMWLAIGSVIVFEIIGAYTLTHFFHISLAGIWIIQAADETVRFSLNYFRFKGGKWKVLNM
jgi:Na+-driven multidrug efflux pump